MIVMDAATTAMQQQHRGDGDYLGHDELPRRHRPPAWQQQQQPRRWRADRSGALEWTAAVVFTVLAIVVLVGALAVLVVVLVLQPRAPYLAIRSARLDGLVYDQQGTLDAELSLGVVAENGNARSDATISHLELRLSFHGMVIAILRADPFGVPRKGSLPLGYVARSSGIPLDGAGMTAMETALANGVVPFAIAGKASTRWKVGGLIPVNYWTRLRCDLRFFWPNGTAVDLSCSSKPKSKSND
ncbi:hypothetical protein GUJ93_ZPchr0008g11793 [Zizania palustris]|uniref:Late embryogenesis abundant protein LEA-2 subgroup domain-containing protein n=1 Tax=Zizania palustris TaxID=103762 RepID=A0A8J5RVW2_ZIZPA|nr:hypothetical protein GUJ93_ZPchr0008g11793 [Zizania palustris]